jgi:hypothetical protein
MTNLSNAWPSLPNEDRASERDFGIVACGALALHIDAIVKQLHLDVSIYPLSPLFHNRPEKIAEEVDQLLTEIAPKHLKRAVAYAECGTYGALDNILEKHQVARLSGDHCYDVFAGQNRIQGLMAENAGTYFFTDYLVKSFQRSVMVELGLDRYPGLRDDYFKNYSRVIWLAQEPNAELEIAAEHAAELIGLPLEVIVVGTDGLASQIIRLVSE